MENGKKIKSISRGIKSKYTPEIFSVDKYVKTDETKPQNHADAWRRGDFKSIVDKNMKGSWINGTGNDNTK